MRSFLFFFPNLVFYSNMPNNGASEGMTGGIDMNFIIEAEVKRMFRTEFEQFHEKVEQSLELP